jgi:16S rRNA (adenine(1408)-N(1))-methyltransferase
VDVGAGDGAATVRAAMSDPGALAIALDASTDVLVSGSRRALRRGLANAFFVVSSIEALPRELEGAADLVTVNFPWGSLLRGIACGHAAVLQALARLAKPGASIHALVSAEPRDRVPGVPPVDAASLTANTPAYRSAGLTIVACRVADPVELRTSGSSWAKRLDVGRSRAAVSLTLLRD